MLMREIPPEDWDAFLTTFNRQHQNEPVTLEKSDIRDGHRTDSHVGLFANSVPKGLQMRLTWMMRIIAVHVWNISRALGAHTITHG